MLGSHPRLFVTNQEHLRRVFLPNPADALHTALLSNLVSLADLDLVAPPIERDQTKIGADGKRVQFHHEARKAVSVIFDTCAAFYITHNPVYLNHSVSVMRHVVDFDDWNGAEKFLDLAEMSLAVSVGYDWLYNHMSTADRSAIQDGIKRHALVYAPAIYGPLSGNSSSQPDENDRGQLEWVRKDNNGNMVNNCGMLAAALAIGDFEPDLLNTVLAGLVPSLSHSMAAYNPDGCWHEGPQYWSYGTQFAVYAISMLESALGTDLGIPDLFPGFRSTALYRYFIVSPAGFSFNYGDNNQAIMSAEPHLTWLSQRFGHAECLAYSRAALSSRIMADKGKRLKKHNKFDRTMALHALWFPASIEAECDANVLSEAIASTISRGKSLDRIFRGPAEIAIMCSSWLDSRAIYVGLKGGKNGGTHGHLDLGSFVLDAGGKRWAAELGGDDYALPSYASKHALSRRWTYLRTSNRGHSTISVGSVEAGGNHVSKIGQSLTAHAPITQFHSSPNDAYAVVDISSVYPIFLASGGTQALRGIRLFNNRSQIFVQDEFIGTPTASEDGERGAPLAVIWRMYTQASIEVASDGRSAVLTIDDQQMLVQIVNASQAVFGAMSAHPSAPSPIPEPENPFFDDDDNQQSCDSDEEEDDDDDDHDGDDHDLLPDLGMMTEKERKKAAQKAIRREARHKQRAEERVVRRAQKAALKGTRGKKDKEKKSGKRKEESEERPEHPESRFRRGVDRSLVEEDPNEGMSCLFITASFFARDNFTLPVVFTPMFDIGKGPWTGRSNVEVTSASALMWC